MIGGEGGEEGSGSEIVFEAGGGRGRRVMLVMLLI